MKLVIFILFFFPFHAISSNDNNSLRLEEIAYIMNQARDHEQRKELRRAHDLYVRAWGLGDGQAAKRLDLLKQKGKKFFQIGKHFLSLGELEATVAFFETAVYLDFEEAKKSREELFQTKEGEEARKNIQSLSEEKKRHFIQKKLKEYPGDTKDLEHGRLSYELKEFLIKAEEKPGKLSKIISLCKKSFHFLKK